MDIVEKRIEQIVPYPGNPRLNEATVSSVAASLKEFGFQQPIVVDKDGVVIVGHARLKAASLLGLETVPVIVASNLTEQQVKTYRLLDNKIAEKSYWNYELLKIELEEFSLEDFEEFKVDFGSLLLCTDGEVRSGDSQDEWVDMPRFEDRENIFRSVRINFEDAEAVQKFIEKTGLTLNEKTKSIWFPEKTKNDYSGVSWKGD